MASSDGTLTIYTQVDTKGVNKGISAINKQMYSLKRVMAGFFGVTSFVMLGKQAIEAASDLAEYRNVAVNTFKELTSELDNFIDNVEPADESLKGMLQGVTEVYGMSRLTATEAASGFMAMGNSIGLTQQAASDMALELTGLVGDFASFYNLSHERARTALAAVYTGETETLKQYGIMLQEVNLQQYENEYGLGRSVSTMTAVEKTMLRYNYIMHATADAQGDFARTANQWANQVRLLKEQWTELLIVLGTGAKTAFAPIIRAMNQAIQKAIDFANVVGQALSKIFNISWTEYAYQSADSTDSTNDLADALEDAGDAADDTSDSLGNAGKAAKKAGEEAKRALAPFDELNVIAERSSSSGSSGSSGSGSGSDSGSSGGSSGDTAAEAGKVVEILHEAESEIDNLFDLGKYIGDAIADTLDAIDWDSVYNHAYKFGVGLAEFLNGINYSRLFDSLGTTIGNALNTVLHFLDGFGTTFDWTQFGNSIASGINHFMVAIDWELALKDAKTWGQGVAQALNGFVSTGDFYEAGRTVAQALNTAITFFLTAGQTLDFKEVGLNIASAVNGFFDDFNFNDLANTLDRWVKGIFTALVTAITNIHWEEVYTSIAEGLDEIDIGTIAIVIGAVTIKNLSAVTTMISDLFLGINALPAITGTTTLMTKIGEVIALVAGGAGTLAESLGAVFGTVTVTVGSILAIIGGAVAAITSFISMMTDGFSGTKEIIMLVGIALVALGAIILGAPAVVAGVVAGIVAVVATLVVIIKEHWDGITQFFSDIWATITGIFSGAVDTIKGAWESVAEWFGSIVDGIINFFTPIGEGISQFFSDAWNKIEEVWGAVVDWFKDTLIDPILGFFEWQTDRIATFFEGCWLIIQAVWIKASEWFNSTFIQPALELFENLKKSIGEKLSAAWKTVQDVWKKAKEWFNTTLIKPVIALFESLKSGISKKLSDAWNTIKGVWSKVSSWFNVNIGAPVKNIFNTLKTNISNALKNAWTSVKNVWTSVTTWFKTHITGPISSAFTSMKQNVVQAFSNMWNGAKNITKSAFNTMIGWIEKGINGIISAINAPVEAFNKVGKWAGKVVGKEYSGLSTIGKVSLPRLANGAVIPPNKEFMAILGDQKHGTNIEAPLDTIVQAFKQAMSEGSIGNSGDITVVAQLDGKVLFKEVVNRAKIEANRTGSNPLTAY